MDGTEQLLRHKVAAKARKMAQRWDDLKALLNSQLPTEVVERGDLLAKKLRHLALRSLDAATLPRTLARIVEDIDDCNSEVIKIVEQAWKG